MFLYYLKEMFKSLFRSKLGSLLVITTTAIAIIFVSISIGLVTFSNSITKKLKDNIKISLFINDSVKSVAYEKIENELKGNTFVESFRLVDKNEALRIMKQKTGQDFLSVLEVNPLPASYVVRLQSDSISTSSIDSIIKTLKNTYGIDEVVYDYRTTLKILNYINSSKQIIYGISLFLAILSVYLVYSNNRLLLSSRVNEYNTMKLVGAKLRTIKIPILLNGVIMGLIASAICLTIFYFFYNFILKFYNTDFIQINTQYLVVTVVLLGIILGFGGSFLATLNVTLKINKAK